MIAFVALLTTTLASGHACAALWECTVKAVYENDKGTLKPVAQTLSTRTDDVLFFDEASGLFRHVDDFRGGLNDWKQTFNVLQVGDDALNPTLAVFQKKGTGMQVAMLITINTYLPGIEKPFTFVDDLTDIVTGTCRKRAR